tara:strand:+ start:684 stop:917 length:234 start_codon:yes stop_codon:yes gene_type:complete
MKDNTFKWVSKFFITLGVIYWVCLVTAALTGCKTTKDCSSCSNCDTCYINPLETTISLDPMDRSQWHEREEFLRHFE